MCIKSNQSDMSAVAGVLLLLLLVSIEPIAQSTKVCRSKLFSRHLTHRHNTQTRARRMVIRKFHTPPATRGVEKNCAGVCVDDTAPPSAPQRRLTFLGDTRARRHAFMVLTQINFLCRASCRARATTDSTHTHTRTQRTHAKTRAPIHYLLAVDGTNAPRVAYCKHDSRAYVARAHQAPYACVVCACGGFGGRAHDEVRTRGLHKRAYAASVLAGARVPHSRTQCCVGI